MRTRSLKPITISWIALVIALIGSGNLAFGQTPSKTSASLEKERALINKDLTRISQQQDRVKALSNKSDKEYNAGKTGTSTRSELIKAQADLSGAKSYLVADKIELLRIHQTVIDARKATIKHEKTGLRSAQRSLFLSQMKRNNSVALYKRQVADRKSQIALNQTALKKEIASRDSDLSTTDKKIQEVSGQSAASLAFEDNWARNQNAIVEK